MMKVTILLSLFVFVTIASAQEGADSTTIPTPVLEQKKKNEISINTAPVFKVLLNAGSVEATRFSATYKRNLTCKSALRFSIMVDEIKPRNYMKTQITLVNDTLIEREDTFFQSYYSPHINLGYERLFGKHKLKWFYGSDIVIGLASSESATYKKRMIIDSVYFLSLSAIGEHYSSEKIGSSKTNMFFVGLSPFFGAKYPISKRFSVSAQVGADMTFQNKEIAETKGSTTNKYHVSAFDFNLNTGIVNDISLIYKF